MAPPTISSGIRLKKGFLTPHIITITDDNGEALDLTAYDAVTFVMVAADGTVIVDNATASFIDKPTGKVKYDFVAEDVSEAGLFKGYFALLIDDEKILSAPTEHFPIEIVDDLIPIS